jgi:hypothetical protein
MKSSGGDRLENAAVADETGSLSSGRMSRRGFGKLLGLQAVLATGAGVVATQAEDHPREGSPARLPDGAITRGAFVAMIADHFSWVHSSEYVDAYKAVQPTFVDVNLGVTPFAKQIEAALEEGILDNAEGCFRPEGRLTREDAADLFVRAYGIPLSAADRLGGFTDASLISPDRRASVNAVVASGVMKGAGAGRWVPKGRLSGREARAVLSALAASRVAPPQVLCKSGTTAPRRYVRISTPTPGATIHYTVAYDGSEPPDPTGPAGQVYDFTVDGVLQFVNPLNSTTDYRLYRLKAVARREGLAVSPVREFTWNIIRPRSGEFQAKLVHAGTATSPIVWKIHNPAEYFQANAYYIEGTTRGLLFDCGEYPYQKADLKTLVDTLATKPYDVVLGHSHPDHAEQIYNFTSAGVALYLSEIERAGLIASARPDFQSAGKAARILADGQMLDLGNVQVTAFQIPGHTNGLTTVIVNQTGWVYGSDMWGCNRPHTADTTQYQGVKVDLFLSLVQQLVANYRKASHSGCVTEVTNAHQETSVGRVCVDNFLKCFQQLIDEGDSVARPSIRGGTKGGDRMSMVGDMWRDRNWMAIGPIGKYAGPVDYLTRPTMAYPCGAMIDYNAADGYRKYSVLSNVEFEGGTLQGVDIHWNAPANGVANRQPNKFDPWTYDYTVTVPPGTTSITIRPMAMSNQVRSMKVNGVAVKQGARTAVTAGAGARITVDVVSPDGSSASSYRFAVAAS